MPQTIKFLKPTQESKYLDGILRNVPIEVKESSHHRTENFENLGINIVGNNYSLYWHSRSNDAYSEFVEIKLKQNLALVDSYLFSSGNNLRDNLLYIPKNWNLECSLDHLNWHVLKEHENETNITYIQQKFIFDTTEQHMCQYFRIKQTGPDNAERSFMYAGPIELFGLVFPIPTVKQKIIHLNNILIISFTFVATK